MYAWEKIPIKGEIVDSPTPREKVVAELEEAPSEVQESPGAALLEEPPSQEEVLPEVSLTREEMTLAERMFSQLAVISPAFNKKLGESEPLERSSGKTLAERIWEDR